MDQKRNLNPEQNPLSAFPAAANPAASPKIGVSPKTGVSQAVDAGAKAREDRWQLASQKPMFREQSGGLSRDAVDRLASQSAAPLRAMAPDADPLAIVRAHTEAGRVMAERAEIASHNYVAQTHAEIAAEMGGGGAYGAEITPQSSQLTAPLRQDRASSAAMASGQHGQANRGQTVGATGEGGLGANQAQGQPVSKDQNGPLDEKAAAQAEADRRNSNQPSERMIGRVSSCSGARAVISTSATHLTGAASEFWSVGRMISIEAPQTRVVAMVCSMHTTSGSWTDGKANHIAVEVELVGEVKDVPGRGPMFKRGVSSYPPLGAVAHRIRARDLEAMHDLGSRVGINVGTLSQNGNIPARISVDDLLKRHFAVLGSTGVGKSCAVTLLVRRMVETVPTLRVVMLDPHNEFLSALSDIAVGTEVEQINLPYWLFKFEELEEVVFKGRSLADESDILRELVIEAKRMRNGDEGSGLSADTPIPYRMTDVFGQIDDIMGQLEPRFDRGKLRSLKVRLDSLFNDPRYAFMFANGGLNDTMNEVMGEVFRLPAHGKPVSVLNLATLPSEVVNAVVSVLARMAFDIAYAAKGALNVLLVCEEAHRYVPADIHAGFMPTRRAIARIAKEGRKYGCAIAVVTQRPGELDPTILSQCSTVFAMRLSNDRDQDIIRSAIADSSSSTLSFLSALDNREAIAFGEGVAAPMRLYFAHQDSSHLPGVQGPDKKIVDADQIDTNDLVRSMRRTVVANRSFRGDVSQNLMGKMREDLDALAAAMPKGGLGFGQKAAAAGLDKRPIARSPIAASPAATDAPPKAISVNSPLRASLLKKPLDIG